MYEVPRLEGADNCMPQSCTLIKLDCTSKIKAVLQIKNVSGYCQDEKCMPPN